MALKFRAWRTYHLATLTLCRKLLDVALAILRNTWMTRSRSVGFIKLTTKCSLILHAAKLKN